MVQSDDEITRCLCQESHTEGPMIACDDCGVWQHVECVLFASKIPRQFYCELCRPTVVEPRKKRRASVPPPAVPPVPTVKSLLQGEPHEEIQEETLGGNNGEIQVEPQGESLDNDKDATLDKVNPTVSSFGDFLVLAQQLQLKPSKTSAKEMNRRLVSICEYLHSHTPSDETLASISRLTRLLIDFKESFGLLLTSESLEHISRLEMMEIQE